MGKSCGMILGMGIAGAIVSLHLYMLMEPRDQRKIKREMKEAVDDLKKATKNLRSWAEKPELLFYSFSCGYIGKWIYCV